MSDADDGQLQSGDIVEKTAALIDRQLHKKPGAAPVGKGPLEVVQSQSMIKSTREEADEQLAAIKAHNDAIHHQEVMAENIQKTKKTGTIVAIVIIFIIIAIVTVWLIVNAINASKPTVQGQSSGGQEEDNSLAVIKGYECKNPNCKTETVVSDAEILIHDGGQFYIYNVAEKKSTLLNIPEQDYHSVTPFVWGDKRYVEIDPESAQAALYSITDNRQLTDFSYDEIFYDINNGIYSGMQYVAGRYIIAKASGTYRLIDLNTGSEVVRAAKRVLAHDDCFYGYENDGSIYVYNASYTRIMIVPQGTHIFTNGRQIVTIHVEGEDEDYEIYEKNGEATEDEGVLDYFGNIEENVFGTIRSNSSFYEIPATAN